MQAELGEISTELGEARRNAGVAGAIQVSSTLPTEDQLWQVDAAWAAKEYDLVFVARDKRSTQQGIREGKDYTIELAELRPDGHKGSEMVEEAIVSLMQTILTVKLSGGRTRRVQFLGGNDMDDPDRPAGALTYSFDKRLVEMLRDSSIWGKIALPVLMAFNCKPLQSAMK